jgi:predicted  nucleic acid-binding Zn-ribbon protein
MSEGKGSRNEPMLPSSQHEDFIELCSLAASGSLNPAEAEKLRQHLSTCSECREALREFHGVVDRMIPGLTPEFKKDLSIDSSFSLEAAEASFQNRLAAEKKSEPGTQDISPSGGRAKRIFRAYPHRYEVWIPLVASAVLCATFGILSYRTGRNHGIEFARLEERSQPADPSAVSEASSAVRAQGTVRDPELIARDTVLRDLRRAIDQKSTEIEKLKALVSSQQVALRAGENDKRNSSEERDRLLRQLSVSEEDLRATQERLTLLERERSEDVFRTASLEKNVADLSRSLEERERETSEQEDLLAKDRDIRELIGARDLYITEIYDVARNGDTRKAAGRVFFTKGKSLVFYAYDLNESPGVKDASTFEAWGQRGPDWHLASKLGIFYQDNVAKKSWVVKSNDRKALAQIDAVFITVEPNGGSERPTGKPLLFAYLKVAPNHP